MQIQPNNSVSPVLKPASKSPVAAKSVPSADRTSFSQSEALRGALQQAPDVRADRVERAKQLVGDVKYPPLETIRGIAVLLAMHLDGDKD